MPGIGDELADLKVGEAALPKSATPLINGTVVRLRQRDHFVALTRVDDEARLEIATAKTLQRCRDFNQRVQRATGYSAKGKPDNRYDKQTYDERRLPKTTKPCRHTSRIRPDHDRAALHLELCGNSAQQSQQRWHGPVACPRRRRPTA